MLLLLLLLLLLPLPTLLLLLPLTLAQLLLLLLLLQLTRLLLCGPLRVHLRGQQQASGADLLWLMLLLQHLSLLQLMRALRPPVQLARPGSLKAQPLRLALPPPQQPSTPVCGEASGPADA